YWKTKIGSGGKDDLWRLFGYFPALFFLGENVRAIEAIRKFRPDVEDDKIPESRAFYVSGLDYMRDPGAANANKLLQAASGSKRRECLAHWFIGCALLGSGDREGARREFEACLATHCHAFFLIPQVCHAYVARMKKDSTWPPWIPVKQDQPKR